MAVRSYDPGEVIVTVGGATMSGFADGTFITIARDEQSFTKVVGADGTTSRVKTNNRGGTCTITLKQTSPSNDVLSGYLAADELNNGGVVNFQLKDASGESVFASGTAWVQGLPSIEYSNEMSNREWVLDLADLEFTVAGNVELTGA